MKWTGPVETKFLVEDETHEDENEEHEEHKFFEADEE
jgi:hypothetical protein